jgi:hypothetical protein
MYLVFYRAAIFAFLGLRSLLNLPHNHARKAKLGFGIMQFSQR